MPASRLALVVDGSFLCHSHWHTDSGRGLCTRDGRPSGVAHGFLSSLCSIWAKWLPAAVYVTWDRRSRHRSALVEEMRACSDRAPAIYKEKRYSDPKAQDDYRAILRPQMDALVTLMPAIGCRSFAVDGLEGDDLVGVLVDSLLEAGYDSLIVSTDKDLYQLLHASSAPNESSYKPGVSILNPRTKRVITEATFRGLYEIDPEVWPQVRALSGDTSDSIPGVPGIGEKTALKMIQRAALQEWLTDNPGGSDKTLTKLAAKVKAHAEQVRIAYELSYILSSVEQFDDDQRRAFLAQWAAVPRVDMDEVRRFIDFYELVAAGSKLMDLVTGSSMAAVRTLEELWAEWGECTRCPLHKCRHRLVYPSGPPTARVAFVGEGPGGGEDFQGIPFVPGAPAGMYLDGQLFAYAGIDRSQVWITNATLCVAREGGALRDLTAGEVAACRPRLQAELRLLAPRLVVLLGDSANKALFPGAGKISDERGILKRHDDFPNVLFLPTFHPSYLMRLAQGEVGPQGRRGSHSDVVKAYRDWDLIGKMVRGEIQESPAP